MEVYSTSQHGVYRVKSANLQYVIIKKRLSTTLDYCKPTTANLVSDTLLLLDYTAFLTHLHKRIGETENHLFTAHMCQDSLYTGPVPDKGVAQSE